MCPGYRAWYPVVPVSVDLVGEGKYIGAATRKRELTLHFLNQWTFREAVSHLPYFFSFFLKPRMDGNTMAKLWL